MSLYGSLFPFPTMLMIRRPSTASIYSDEVKQLARPIPQFIEWTSVSSDSWHPNSIVDYGAEITDAETGLVTELSARPFPFSLTL